MRLKLMKVLVILCLVMGFSGCYAVTLDARNADVAILMSGPGPDQEVIRHFHFQTTSHHIVFGLAEIIPPDITPKIEAEVKAAGGRMAANVRIQSKFDVIDWLLNLITGGIYTPFTVLVEGDVVR